MKNIFKYDKTLILIYFLEKYLPAGQTQWKSKNK